MMQNPAPFLHQNEGASWLLRKVEGRQNQLLADDPGLGKTRTAIMALDTYGVTRVLIVCPAVARPVWEQQWKKWLSPKDWIVDICYTSPKLHAAALYSVAQPRQKHVIITGFDMWSTKSLVGAAGESDARLALLQTGYLPNYMIIDEGHYLKELDSNRTREIFGYAEYTGLITKGRVLVMTGTPAPNHYGEVYPMLRRLWPEDMVARGFASRHAFEAHFCVKKDVFLHNKTVTIITGSKNHRDLKDILKTKMLRRKKTEVFKDMPPLIFDTLPLDVQAATQDITIPDMDIYNDDELLVMAKQAPATQRRLVGMSKVGPSVQYIQEQLDNNPSHKMVIFAVHHDVIDALVKALANNYQGVVVDGRVSDTNRSIAVDRFQNDPRCRVFIGQIQAAGTAITLTAANEVLFVESDYVPMNNYQAACRCHRIGTTAPVIARHAIIPHTVDRRIMEILARKEAEIAKVF